MAGPSAKFLVELESIALHDSCGVQNGSEVMDEVAPERSGLGVNDGHRRLPFMLMPRATQPPVLLPMFLR